MVRDTPCAPAVQVQHVNGARGAPIGNLFPELAGFPRGEFVGAPERLREGSDALTDAPGRANSQGSDGCFLSPRPSNCYSDQFRRMTMESRGSAPTRRLLAFWSTPPIDPARQPSLAGSADPDLP